MTLALGLHLILLDIIFNPDLNVADEIGRITGILGIVVAMGPVKSLAEISRFIVGVILSVIGIAT